LINCLPITYYFPVYNIQFASISQELPLQISNIVYSEWHFTLIPAGQQFVALTVSWRVGSTVKKTPKLNYLVNWINEARTGEG